MRKIEVVKVGKVYARQQLGGTSTQREDEMERCASLKSIFSSGLIIDPVIS